jgi:Domain of unknown function (DUF3597)
MGIFTNLMSKIFGHATAAPSGSAAPLNTAVASAAPSTPTTPASDPAPSPVSEPAKTVDVTAILNDLAAKNPEKLDWRKSIVDLMKLVGIDSSLSARKQLAAELHYSGDVNDSATMCGCTRRL